VLNKTLTVKNLSAVGVSVSVSVGAPFGVASGSSFSLDPQKSQEVVVSFSPTATGSYAGTASVKALGLTAASVSAKGLGITPEDYLATLADLSSASNFNLKLDGRSILAVQSEEESLLLTGFDSVSKPDLDRMFELASQPRVGVSISPSGISICISWGIFSVCWEHIVQAYEAYQNAIKSAQVNPQEIGNAILAVLTSADNYSTECNNNPSFKFYLEILYTMIHQTSSVPNVCIGSVGQDLLGIIQQTGQALSGRDDLMRFLVQNAGPMSLMVAQSWTQASQVIDRLQTQYGSQYDVDSFTDLVARLQNLLSRAPDMGGHVVALLQSVWFHTQQLLGFAADDGGGEQQARGFEGLARAFATIETANRLLDNGWALRALAYSTYPPFVSQIDVMASKDNTTGFIVIEPYLTTGNDLDALVVRINGGDPAAVQQLCHTIRDPNSGYPHLQNPLALAIMVIFNGQVTCTNDGVATEGTNHVVDFPQSEAEQLCQDMGLCSAEPPPSGEPDVLIRGRILPTIVDNQGLGR
jgi:hypothetical protein